jgi:3-hydroxyisobutyrate dehydrogenase-like beta-hydroxyacid dehydrogenase
MAKNLAAKGSLSLPLIVYNRNTARAHEFQARNANTIVATSVGEAVSKADIILTCVGDDDAIREIANASVTTGTVQNKIFVDCSTVHPDTTTAIAQLFQQHGARFVASPVFGAPAMAALGQIIPVLAGPSDAIEQVKPFTTGVIAKGVIEFRDQPPAMASQLKILGNTFVLTMVESIAEGLVVAEKCGLGADALHQFFEAVFPGPYVAYSNRMRSGDYHERTEPLFAIDLARKDGRHALDLADKAGAAMQGVQLAESYMVQVKAHIGTRGDLASVYGVARLKAGLNFEN